MPGMLPLPLTFRGGAVGKSKKSGKVGSQVVFPILFLVSVALGPGLFVLLRVALHCWKMGGGKSKEKCFGSEQLKVVFGRPTAFI